MIEREIIQERQGLQKEAHLIDLLREKCKSYYKACDQEQLDKLAEDIHHVLTQLGLQEGYQPLIKQLDKERGPIKQPHYISHYE